MATIEIKPAVCKSHLKIPTSKSYANRMLPLAATYKGQVTLRDMPLSSDVQTMIESLKALGLEMEINGFDITIQNSFPNCEPNKELIEIPTGDGGTTNRFLTALCARGSKKYLLKPTLRMKERPMEGLYKVLRAAGAKIEIKDEGIFIQGPCTFKEEEVGVDCSETTQFLTGLKCAFPEKARLFKPLALHASEDYLRLTEETLNWFKSESSQLDLRVPVDFSGLGYPLALGILTEGVHIQNCFERDHLQADSVILEYLKNMGVQYKFTEDGLKVEPTKNLKSISMDVSKSPDLFPTMAFLCSYATGESEFLDMEVLKHKESDRIQEVLRLLELFEIDHDYLQEEFRLIINGRAKKVGEKEVYPYPDHRIVMVAGLFLATNSGGTLHNSEHVKKSYPEFYEIME